MAARAVLTSPDIAEETEMTETVSTAMLVVLETLTPVERAVFVLREVFGYSHAEIARLTRMRDNLRPHRRPRPQPPDRMPDFTRAISHVATAWLVEDTGSWPSPMR